MGILRNTPSAHRLGIDIRFDPFLCWLAIDMWVRRRHVPALLTNSAYTLHGGQDSACRAGLLYTVGLYS